MAGEYLYAVSNVDMMYNRKISCAFLPFLVEGYPYPFSVGKFRPKIAKWTRHDFNT